MGVGGTVAPVSLPSGDTHGHLACAGEGGAVPRFATLPGLVGLGGRTVGGGWVTCSPLWLQ